MRAARRSAEHRPALRTAPNSYITPELSFEFHYFFMRKFWFAYLAKPWLCFLAASAHSTSCAKS